MSFFFFFFEVTKQTTMRTIEVNIYKYSDLSDAAKLVVLDKNKSINFKKEFWYTPIYNRWKSLWFGIRSHESLAGDEPQAFGNFFGTAVNTADRINNHCSVISPEFILSRGFLINFHFNVNIGVDTDQLCQQYRSDLLVIILNELKREHTHLYSNEAIIDTINKMGLEFRKNGDLFIPDEN
jgi:hypothetical protein